MNEMVYATSIVFRHPEPGEFARVLIPAPCGTRYRDARPERSTSTRAARWTPKPLVSEAQPHVSKYRWPQERLDALPRESGYLRLVGHSPIGESVMVVTLRCSGPHPKCAGTLHIPASKYAAPSSRPKGCWHCSLIGRRNANPPISNRGADLARAHVAKQKAHR